ncbi:MAG: hypothetical protein F9K23_17040 [Bacteroidetes bacterium]|nr:MAG: hypothetical protein F9K23_17040 [Bacteroidota bacterium]
MNSQGIKDIGIGAGVLLLAYGAYRFFRKKDMAETIGTDEYQEAQVKQIPVDTKKLTRDSFYYKNIADQLYNEMSKRFIVFDIYTYNSSALFSYVQGLNADELKQVVKYFGVRSQKAWVIYKLSDGGTLFEWFDNILTKDHLEKMRDIFKPTGLWQSPAPKPENTAYVNYLNQWMGANLGKVKYPNPRLAIGRPVYSTYTGKENIGYLDNGWWDINSWRAKKGQTGDFYVRPSDAIRPIGTISDVLRLTEGDKIGQVPLIKVKITHPQLFTNAPNPLLNREVWLIPSRLTDTPYNPTLKGLPTAYSQSLSNLL